MKKCLFIIFLLLFQFTLVKAQNDTLISRKGEIYIGTINSLSESVVRFSSVSGKSEYRINWKEVVKVNTYHPLRIINRDKELIEGFLVDSNAGDDSLQIKYQGQHRTIAYSDLISLRKLESSFKEKIDLGANLGYSYAKGTNTQQLSFRTNGSFTSKRWSLDGEYNRFITIIDSLQNSRLDASINNRYILPKNWFTMASFSWLSSDEQELQLRTTIMLGGGRYLILDQRKSLQFSTGVALNEENFSGETNRYNESYEAFFGGRYHLFDHEFLSIESSATGFASLTESDRYRATFALDLGWDLASNFDLIWGYSLNFDSNPPNNSQETDYVISLTLGWSL